MGVEGGPDGVPVVGTDLQVSVVVGQCATYRMPGFKGHLDHSRRLSQSIICKQGESYLPCMWHGGFHAQENMVPITGCLGTPDFYLATTVRSGGLDEM